MGVKSINQSERHLTFPLRAGALVLKRIPIITVDLPGARQERFTAEETDVLVRAVKHREVTLGMEKPTQINFG